MADLSQWAPESFDLIVHPLPICSCPTCAACFARRTVSSGAEV
jgi:hypothetical protein